MKSYRVREKLHDELLYHLLFARGITQVQEIQEFLEPVFERDSHDAMLLPDMAKAVDRILAAHSAHERIAVWSDYDCDGIPGGVLLTEFFRSIGFEVFHYIPHRHKEGYGLNVEGISELALSGVTLIITVDLGTTEHEEISFAKEKGIDVIVTDHHIVQDASHLPNALAVINPKRPDSAYPFDGLCGAGVAWKLVQGVLSKNRFGLPEGHEKWFLDLVGIATLSDMVPLVGENRMLARYGLVVMRKARRPGLAELLKLLRIKPATLTEDDIGFMVSPRINAASRMDKPQTAAQLLSTSDKAEAADLARELSRVNDERKGVVAATVKEVNRRLKEQPNESPVIVMGNPNWRPGILGLVANSLAQAHGKPVFLWGREGGDTIRGSVRSPDVNVVELMTSAKELFDEFGGHSASGGFSISQDNVYDLQERLARGYESLRSSRAQSEEVLLDRELELEEISFAARDLTKLAPFGEGNKKPMFMFPGVSILRARSFGKNSDHLEVELTKGTQRISGVAFFSTVDSFSKFVEAGSKADVVGAIENDWRGHPRLRVVDVI
jgi:single-stranded-DNA-specific exonuclease